MTLRGIPAMLAMWVLLSQCRGLVGLVAYDCADRNVNITTISLRSVAECPEPDSSYESEQLMVQVMQRSEMGFQHVWSCLIEITRLITYCGMHSHSSIVSGGLFSYIHRVGAEECKAIHRTKTYVLQKHTIGNILLNGITTAAVNLRGYIDNSGSCEGISYQEDGTTWKNVVITANVKITTMDYFAKVKLKDNEISLKGGITCPFLENYCFDSTLGESTWTYKSETSCNEQAILLYSGKAERVRNLLTNEQYVVVDQGQKIFAVTLIKKILFCGAELWQTEHPQLLVSEGRAATFESSAQLTPETTDLMLYVNSKFLYVEQSYKRDLDMLSIDTIHRRCLLHREVLNRLLLAPLVPDAVSQLIQEKEGYIGHVVGEVLYILRCVPKRVIIRRSEICYNELPVFLNNQSKFMAPVTRILQGHGEEIECNGLTPPLYHLEGEWIGLIPHPTSRRTPKELAVGSYPKVSFQPIQPLGTMVYTPKKKLGRCKGYLHLVLKERW